jgi:hypothetical protein
VTVYSEVGPSEVDSFRVTSVGFSSMPLLQGYAWQNAVQGKDFEGAPIKEQPVLSEIGPDYFATLGIPIARACLHRAGCGTGQIRCHQ